MSVVVVVGCVDGVDGVRLCAPLPDDFLDLPRAPKNFLERFSGSCDGNSTLEDDEVRLV